MMVEFDRPSDRDRIESFRDRQRQEELHKAHKGWQLLVLAGVAIGVVLVFMGVI